jgi:hypothetical protein
VATGLNAFDKIFYLLPKYILGTYVPDGTPVAHRMIRYSLPIEVLYLAPAISLPVVLGLLFLIIFTSKHTKNRSKIEFARFLYLLIAVPTFLSLIKPLYPFTGFLLPGRNLVLLYLLAYPLILFLISTFVNEKIKIISELRKVSEKIKPSIRTDFLALLLIALLFTGMHYYFINVKKLAWYDPSPTDIQALEWINKNVSENELILNDASFISLFLQGYSIKNLTFWMWTWNTHLDYTNKVFNETFGSIDVQDFYEALVRYNISYIFLSSENMYLWRLTPLSELPETYKPWKYATKEWPITESFENMPFLEKVFEKGETKIYKVLRTIPS